MKDKAFNQLIYDTESRKDTGNVTSSSNITCKPPTIFYSIPLHFTSSAES